jgi:hypothetical protein
MNCRETDDCGPGLVAWGGMGGALGGTFYGFAIGMIAPKSPDVIYRGR